MYWNCDDFIKKGERDGSWIVTLDVLKSYYNFFVLYLCWSWIVTLDVLKFLFSSSHLASAICWIVTLDVLKFN